jgi:SlyX protein
MAEAVISETCCFQPTLRAAPQERVIMQERLTEIEIKLSQQEDLLDTLNQTVYRQQEKIDELEALCAALARRLRDAAHSGDAEDSAPGDEKPPHY